MQNGNCPKCGKDEIYVKTENHAGLLKGASASNSIPLNTFKLIYLDNYVCINCGYLESYISDMAKVAEIKEHWAKKEPTK